MNALLEWLGAGGNAVPAIQADGRAQACIAGNDGKPCPFNKAPLWWETAKGSIAEAIRAMLAVKNNAEMHVKGESDLHICSKCGCCLQLKVWTPIEHVAKAVDRETVADVPYCWIRKELS